MRGFTLIRSADDVHKYVNSWDVPNIVQANDKSVVVKMPERHVRLMTTLIKSHAVTELEQKLVVKPLSFVERIQLFFC